MITRVVYDTKYRTRYNKQFHLQRKYLLYYDKSREIAPTYWYPRSVCPREPMKGEVAVCVHAGEQC